MMENESYESALVDICKDFMAYLCDMKRSGLISEAEYESHSNIKMMFIEQYNSKETG